MERTLFSKSTVAPYKNLEGILLAQRRLAWAGVGWCNPTGSIRTRQFHCTGLWEGSHSSILCGLPAPRCSDLPGTFALSSMNDSIESLGNARFFTVLDALWEYWQIPVKYGDKDKTKFTSHLCTNRYTSKPFALPNAPATLWRSLDIILSGVRYVTCLVKNDYVVVF